VKFKKAYSYKKQPVFGATGTFIGTTYSGHPSCTSNHGTSRNCAYNYFVQYLINR